MSDYNIIKYIYLKDRHIINLKTVHYIDNKLMDTPYQLQIVQYHNDSGFYLFYLNSQGKELTDTYHENLPDAFKQAEWEFGILQNEWM